MAETKEGLTVDGFNQKIIDGTVFHRLNNPASPIGCWKDPQGKAIMDVQKNTGRTCKKIARAEDKMPANFKAPKDETKDAKKIREAAVDRWKEERAGQYDIYVAQGNPVTVFKKLKPEKK